MKFISFFSCLFFSLALSAQSFQWAKQIGGTSIDQGYAVKTDSAGNVYVAGSFRETADFDPGVSQFTLTSNTANPDGFVCKLNEDGDFLWAIQLGGSQSDEVRSLTLDADGNVLVTGIFEGSATFGTYTLSIAGAATATFVVKISPAGTVLWAKQLAHPLSAGSAFGFSIASDDIGNVFTTGYFNGEIDFDPSASTDAYLTSTGMLDMFVCKLTTGGDFGWARRIGGDGSTVGYAIACDASGDVLVTGTFTFTTDFDPGASVQNITAVDNLQTDAFLLKLSAAGDFAWVNRIGGKRGDRGNALVTDDASNIYITGRFQDTVDFDPGVSVSQLYATTNNAIFVARYTTSGTFDWVKGLQGDPELTIGEGKGITLDDLNNVYVVGDFAGEIDFDPGAGTFNLATFGASDVFISKLTPAGDFIWATRIGGGGQYDYGSSIDIDVNGAIVSGGSFAGTTDFNPLGSGFSVSSFGSWEDAFVLKIAQCVLSVEVVANNQTMQLEAQSAATDYQWYDCSTNQPILDATTPIINPPYNGEFYVEATLGNCTVTSDCIYVDFLESIDPLEETLFWIYPVPVTDILHIQTSAVGTSTLVIYSMHGTQVTSITLNASAMNLNVQAWPAGMYFIRNASGTFVRRFVKM